MSRFFSGLLLVTFSVTSFAEPARYCVMSGFLNDIVYRVQAACSDKYRFRDSLLGPISRSRRMAAKAKLVGDLERAGLYFSTTVGGYEIYTDSWNVVDAQKSSLCLVKSRTAVTCTPGVSVKIDAANGETAESVLSNSGFSKALGNNGFLLYVK